MLKLISCTTGKLSKKQKFEIVKLKNSHWKYGIKKQLLHYKENFKKKDINNLLYYQEKLIGFTALRYCKKRINNSNLKYLLFDTLIIHKSFQGKKFSTLLMIFNNTIIQKKKIISFLACEDKVLSFYKKYGWKIYQKKKFFASSNKKIMFFNSKIKI